MLVFFIQKGVIKLYNEQGYPFVKYDEGDIVGDSDTLLDVIL